MFFRRSEIRGWCNRGFVGPRGSKPAGGAAHDRFVLIFSWCVGTPRVGIILGAGAENGPGGGGREGAVFAGVSCFLS